MPRPYTPPILTDVIGARFTSEEKARLEHAAAYYNMPVGHLIRSIALSWLNSSSPSDSSFIYNNSINVERTPTSEKRRRKRKGEREQPFTPLTAARQDQQPTPSPTPAASGRTRLSDEEWAQTQGLELARKQAAEMQQAEIERRKKIEAASRKAADPNIRHRDLLEAPFEAYEEPEEDVGEEEE